MISIKEIKGFARKLPKDHVLRDVILAENDSLTPQEFKAKWEIWFKLLKAIK